MPYELGVDLGTTFTAAAVRDGGEPTMVGLGNRALQVPSVLFWTGSGFLVGEAAERRGAGEPRRLVREFKRRLGDPVPVLVDGVPFSAESLSATLLRWVVDAVTRRQGEPPSGLVLTHPASWGEYKLDVLRQVAALAEVGPARWCAEPVAAAAQYASRSRVAVGERLAVYDLGGGTFDACVLEQTDRGFVMLGPAEGVEHLGGVDFDEAVFEQVRAGLGDRLAALDPDDPDTTAALARLRRECVEAKEALSVDAETTVPVALPGVLTTVRMTRAELEQLIGPAVDQTVAATTRAVRAAGLEPRDLRGVVLVGGSSRIPLVGEVLQQRLKVPVALDTHPKHDVALGALRQVAPAASPAPVASATGTGQAVSAAPPGPVAPVQPPPRPAPTGRSKPARTRTPKGAPVAPSEPPERPVAASAATARPTSRPAPPGAPPPPVPPELLSLGPEEPGDRPARSRRTRLLVGAGAVVLVLVLAIVVIPRLVGRPATPGAAPPTPAPASDGASSSPAASPTVALPQSAPLTDDQLLVSMPVDGNTDLYLASSTSPGPLRRLTRDADVDAYPVVSPDRRTVIYQQISKDGSRRVLWVAGAADGAGNRALVTRVPKPCAQRMGRPAWNPAHPDVLAVVCVSASEEIGLYLIRTDGTLVSRIPLPGLSVGDPTFSPDGARLAFWSAARRDWNAGDIYVLPADGSGTPTKITTSTLPTQYADPAFSPDGLSVAYRRRDPGATPDGDAHIYVVNADGSGTPRPLAVTTGANEQDPSYSPRGDQIAYLSNREAPGLPGRPNRVWIMGSDGQDQHVLLTAGSQEGQTSVSWTPR